MKCYACGEDYTVNSDEIHELKKRIAELEDFVRDYAGQTCKCGYPNVCATCKDIAYAKEILKGGE